MSLLRKTRAEMAGAWRSLRYDLGRRPAEPETAGPDVTSTGMNTFGGVILPDAASRVPAGAPGRPPRRAAAVTMLGVLTVGGAAGAYLAVVNGLGSLMAETSAAADTFPPAPPAVTVGVGSAPRPAKPAPVRAGHTAAPHRTAVVARTVAPIRRPAAASRPVRTAKPTSTDCDCRQPPVPTPTAPTSPVPVPPATSVSASTDPSPSEPAATTPASAEPSETSDNPLRRHPRWGN